MQRKSPNPIVEFFRSLGGKNRNKNEAKATDTQKNDKDNNRVLREWEEKMISGLSDISNPKQKELLACLSYLNASFTDSVPSDACRLTDRTNIRLGELLEKCPEFKKLYDQNTDIQSKLSEDNEDRRFRQTDIMNAVLDNWFLRNNKILLPSESAKFTESLATAIKSEDRFEIDNLVRSDNKARETCPLLNKNASGEYEIVSDKVTKQLLTDYFSARAIFASSRSPQVTGVMETRDSTDASAPQQRKRH